MLSKFCLVIKKGPDDEKLDFKASKISSPSIDLFLNEIDTKNKITHFFVAVLLVKSINTNFNKSIRFVQ